MENTKVFFSILQREAAKKTFSLYGRAIKAYHPPPSPSSLMAVGTLGKKGFKKVIFSLMALNGR